MIEKQALEARKMSAQGNALGWENAKRWNEVRRAKQRQSTTDPTQMPFAPRKVADLSMYKRHLYVVRMPTYHL